MSEYVGTLVILTAEEGRFKGRVQSFNIASKKVTLQEGNILFGHSKMSAQSLLLLNREDRRMCIVSKLCSGLRVFTVNGSWCLLLTMLFYTGHSCMRLISEYVDIINSLIDDNPYFLCAPSLICLLKLSLLFIYFFWLN